MSKVLDDIVYLQDRPGFGHGKWQPKSPFESGGDVVPLYQEVDAAFSTIQGFYRLDCIPIPINGTLVRILLTCRWRQLPDRLRGQVWIVVERTCGAPLEAKIDSGRLTASGHCEVSATFAGRFSDVSIRSLFLRATMPNREYVWLPLF